MYCQIRQDRTSEKMIGICCRCFANGLGDQVILIYATRSPSSGGRSDPGYDTSMRPLGRLTNEYEVSFPCIYDE